jgi:hypothetical protein
MPNPPTLDPEMHEIAQQMQQITVQAMQKMAEKGIEPREIFGEIQASDGPPDMAVIQQKLVDRGLIDKESITKLQTKAQSASLNSIRRQLGVTDDAEWAIILPKIQRIVNASADSETSKQMPGIMMIPGLTNGQRSKSDVTMKKQALQAALANATTTQTGFQIKIDALREARQKANEELNAARKDLMEVLTVRQEGILTILGLL